MGMMERKMEELAKALRGGGMARQHRSRLADAWLVPNRCRGRGARAHRTPPRRPPRPHPRLNCARGVVGCEGLRKLRRGMSTSDCTILS